MNQIRRLVVGVLLAVWCFPALSQAAPGRNEGKLPAAVTETAAQRTPAPTQSTQAPASGEAQRLADREKQTPELQNFKGGGVYIYMGSGVLLVAVIILLILLI